MSAHLDDLIPLIPGHFLIGRPLTAHPEPDLQDVPQNRLTRWQLVQQTYQNVIKITESVSFTTLILKNKYNMCSSTGSIFEMMAFFLAVAQ